MPGMPELPEVEVTRRSIAGVCGANVLSLRLGKPLRWPLGTDPAGLAGLQVGPLQRRGKYLLMPLQAGDQVQDLGAVVEVHVGLSTGQAPTVGRQIGRAHV